MHCYKIFNFYLYRKHAKKKVLKKQLSKKGKNSTNDKLDFNTLDYAKQANGSINNVYTFSPAYGLKSDDISYLERQYIRMNDIIKVNKKKLEEGYEQLIGDQRNPFTIGDSELLLKYSDINLDEASNDLIVKNSILPSIIQNKNDTSNMDIDIPQNPEIDIENKMDDYIENNEILNFDVWLICVLSCVRQRLMTCVLGGKYGYSPVTFLDNIDNYTPGDGSGFNRGRGVAGGTGATRHQISVNDYFQKSLEQSSLVFDENLISRGNSRGRSREKSRKSEKNDFENSEDNGFIDQENFNADNDIVFDGSVDIGNYTGKTDKKRKISLDLNEDSLVSDFNNQMNDEYNNEKINDNSNIEIMKHKILSSQSMANFSNISNKMKKSVSNTLPLPPIRMQYLNALEKKRKMLMRSGYDESFGRATPRCLRSEADKVPNIPSSFGGCHFYMISICTNIYIYICMYAFKYAYL